MSGHSKWSNIKRKKDARDSQRGKIFSKLAREITVAARLGGGDPDMNPRLRLVVTKARDANMPADNIKRAIQRGTGELDGVQYEEITFEGYGPGGIALVIETISDNRNRIVSEIRAVFKRYGGSLAEKGAVTWNFSRKGVIVLPRDEKQEEKLIETAIAAGAGDFEIEGDDIIISTSFEEFENVRKELEENGVTIKHSEVGLVPGSYVEADVSTAETVLKLVEALEELDDVSSVTTNLDIPENLVEKLGV